jgi:hypothetical protein
LFSISCIEIPPIYAKYGGTIGSTHGLKKLKIPAIKAITIEGNKPASIISIPNILNNTLLNEINHPIYENYFRIFKNFKET